jgi:hypothetical protein
VSEAKTLDDMQILGPSELGKLLGRSTKTIKVDASRRPDTLPPRFVVPGTRKLSWRVLEVRQWMNALAAVEQQKRVAQRQLALKAGVPVAPRKPFALAKASLGAAATAQMKKTATEE